MLTIRFLVLAICLHVALLVGCDVNVSDRSAFPVKPIKIVVYTGPGGLIDQTARKFSDVASKYVDATFVVENKPGAGGIVALKKVLQAPADGYTLYACTKSNISKIVSSAGDSYIDAFDWIAMIMADPECIITRAGGELSDWQAVVNDAQLKQGRQIWVGPARGGLDHVMAIKTWEKFGISAQWVPFTSGGSAKAALLGQQGVAYVGNPQDALGNPDLKVAVVSNTKRLSQFPEAPTFAEFGVEGLDNEFMWRGFAIKKGGPREALDWYDKLFQQVNADPQWREFWGKGGIDVTYLPAEEFTPIVHRDREEFGHYLQQIGIIQSASRTPLATWLQGTGLLGIVCALLLGNGLVFLILRTTAKSLPGRFLIPTVLVSISGLFYAVSRIFPETDGVGSAAVPRLWIVLLIPICLYLVVRESISERPSKSADSQSNSVAQFALLLAVYVIGVHFFGYFISSFIFLCVAMYLLGMRHAPTMAGVSAGWLLLSYLLFVRLLYVPLPTGAIFEQFWR